MVNSVNLNENNGHLVGIAMATYNPDLDYFRDQINSLKNQTHKNWKCIIVDDASKIDFFEEIKKLVEGDGRFEIFRNEVNLGSFKTFERALQFIPIECEFICFCDQDDIWISTKIELQLQALTDPNISLVHSDQSLIDEKNRVFVASCWSLEGRNILEANTDLLLFRNLITGCTAMFRSQILKGALPFYPLKERNSMYHHDMWLAMHACVHGRVVGIKEPLVLYRQHGANLVGVAGLRKRAGARKLAVRAFHAYKERLNLRNDFVHSLTRYNEDVRNIQIERLSYLDSPIGLMRKGLSLTMTHPHFFRIWVMLVVGLSVNLFENGKKLISLKV